MDYKSFQIGKKKAVGDTPVDIYFRSSTNGWSLDNQFYQFADGCYVCRNIDMPSGFHEFKIADKSYNEINLGSIIKSSINRRRYVGLDNKTSKNARLFMPVAESIDIFLKQNEDGNYSVLIR